MRSEPTDQPSRLRQPFPSNVHAPLLVSFASLLDRCNARYVHLFPGEKKDKSGKLSPVRNILSSFLYSLLSISSALLFIFPFFRRYYFSAWLIPSVLFRFQDSRRLIVNHRVVKLSSNAWQRRRFVALKLSDRCRFERSNGSRAAKIRFGILDIATI